MKKPENYRLHEQRMDWKFNHNYIQISDMSRSLVGNKSVDHSDVVGAMCRRCSNYIFILQLSVGFNGLRRCNCKTRRETFKFWDSVRIILDIWR